MGLHIGYKCKCQQNLISVTSIFGSSESQVSSQQVRGGRIFALFGGSEIDLRRAALSDGQAAVQVLAIFGSVRLTVPEDWAVNARTGAVLGSIDYRRAGPASSATQLTLSGFSLFGRIK